MTGSKFIVHAVIEGLSEDIDTLGFGFAQRPLQTGILCLDYRSVVDSL